tara:strand:- start:1006 stop:1977 length:972 start_codon:yes stop_codon:yes gene_type:complete
LTERLEEFLNTQNLLLVSNGTLALHIAYKVLGIKKSICTPFSFAATVTALDWEKINYGFSDICPQSLNLDPHLVQKKLESDKSVNAIVATHVYGNPCDLEQFEELRSNHNVKVVYDGSHAFGVRYKNNSIFNFGDATTLSFHATKIFHTGEGGGIIFRSKDDFINAKKMINFSLDERGIPTGAGINAKLSEYQAAIGLTILDEIDQILETRQQLFFAYEKFLSPYFELPKWNDNVTKFNGAYFPVLLKNFEKRNKVIQALSDKNIASRTYFGTSLNQVYDKNSRCPISEDVSSRVLCLPLHSYMNQSEVQEVSDNLLKLANPF